jgi:peptidoglycan/xylan/chitin deacetylase (PgdA/CDA1 family)
MRSLALWMGGFAALLLVSTSARAEQRWILADPIAQPIAKLWAEGTLESHREDGRSIATLTTDGKGHPTLAALQSLDPVVDANGRFAQAVVRVRGIEHLVGIEVRFSSDGMQSSWLSLPVLLYGDREYNFVQEDTWASITLSFGPAVASGKPDRKRIDSVGIMVTDDGKGEVEVDLAGIALVDAPKQGVVSFTFDDGYKEHLAAARLLAERGWSGTAYVIPQLIGQGPVYLTEADVAELRKIGFDVAAHDDPPLTQVPAAELEPRMRGIQDWLAKHGFAEGGKHLAYPLGKQEPKRVRPTIARVFTTARIAGGGPETIPPADPHLLRAVNVMDKTTPEEVGAWARRARDEGEWLLLMFHWLPEKTEKGTDYSMSDFRRAIDAVAKAKVRVATVSEVWREVAPLVASSSAFPPQTTHPAAPAP